MTGSLLVNSADVAKRKELFDTVREECNSYGVAASNTKYQLDQKAYQSIENLLLHVPPTNFAKVQGIDDMCPASVVPFSGDTLTTSGWLLGDVPKSVKPETCRVTWAACMKVMEESQGLHLDRARRLVKLGRSCNPRRPSA